MQKTNTIQGVAIPCLMYAPICQICNKEPVGTCHFTGTRTI